MRQQKKKFTIEQQIRHMKEQNIRFLLFTEKDAKDFLRTQNYYFKVKSFAKNYEKINNKYKDLDFAYLRKFSILDTLFRDLILEISLLCEHILRTDVCYISSINGYDDGYGIVTRFLYQMQEKYEQNGNSGKKLPKTLYLYDEGKAQIYSKDMLDKYRLDLPIWVFIEILSFGELIDFYKYYIEKYNIRKQDTVDIFDLYTIKSIRNVAAHNNCILHTLTAPPLGQMELSVKLKNFLQSKKLLSRTKKEIRIPMLHDFLCLILTYNKLCHSIKTRGIIKSKIEDFLNKCEKHPEYFCSNTLIKERYDFIKHSVIAILS